MTSLSIWTDHQISVCLFAAQSIHWWKLCVYVGVQVWVSVRICKHFPWNTGGFWEFWTWAVFTSVFIWPLAHSKPPKGVFSQTLFHHPMLQMSGKPSARDLWVTRMWLFKSAQRRLLPHLPRTFDTAANSSVSNPGGLWLYYLSSDTQPIIPVFSSTSLGQFPIFNKQSFWELSPVSSQNSISQRVEHTSEILGGTKKWTFTFSKKVLKSDIKLPFN